MGRKNSEFKNRSTEISLQNRKKKKLTRTSGTCGIPTKYTNMTIILVPREERMKGARKIFKEIITKPPQI